MQRTIKNPTCANTLGFIVQNDMNEIQYLRHLNSEQKLMKITSSMRTETKFSRYIKKLIGGTNDFS